MVMSGDPVKLGVAASLSRPGGNVTGTSSISQELLTANSRQVVAAVEKIRLPAIYANAEFAHSGGLMAYAANLSDGFRRAATYVDKILKGTKPGDLPIEQPTKVEFAINMKAAKALGLTIPRSLLLRADDVIQ
jgi:putative ABC transport system substrate-binding protein